MGEEEGERRKGGKRRGRKGIIEEGEEGGGTIWNSFLFGQEQEVQRH